jgi:DNA-directed RNA polymerase subunit RPC12/RpoP
MSGERLTAGSEVSCGVYRCNACAKQIDLQEDKTRLPQCTACGGFAWRTKRECKISDSTQSLGWGGDNEQEEISG